MTAAGVAGAEDGRGAFLSSLRRELAFLASSFWDRAMLGLIPLVLLAVVSIELADGVLRDLPIAVVDQDGGSIARELTRRLDAAPGLSVAALPANMATAERLVRMREIYAVVLIPREASRSVMRGETGSIMAFYNASYSTASGAAMREIGATVQAYAGQLAVREAAALAGPARVRAPPVGAQSAVLFNPQGSYELQLVGLLHPALLHLIFMVAVVSALGRELRDGTIGGWLSTAPAMAAAQVAGKLLPYFLVFMLWSLVVTAYLAGIRGWPIAGSPMLILAGYAGMYLAYAGVSLLLIGLTSSMAQTLSLSGLYAGASFAFAGVIFPIESASAFARIWNAILPYTAFANLWSEQYVMGAPVAVSLRQIGIMLIFLVVGAGIGLPLYARAAGRPRLWGKR
jgi:ABC-2 type transport system permease protein